MVPARSYQNRTYSRVLSWMSPVIRSPLGPLLMRTRGLSRVQMFAFKRCELTPTSTQIGLRWGIRVLSPLVPTP